MESRIQSTSFGLFENARKFAGIKEKACPTREEIERKVASLPNAYAVGHGVFQGKYTLLEGDVAVSLYSAANAMLTDSLRNAALAAPVLPEQIQIFQVNFSLNTKKLPIPDYAYCFPQTAIAENDCQIPNYLLCPFNEYERKKELEEIERIAPNAKLITVTKPTHLSTLLTQYNGYHIHWLACTAIGPGTTLGYMSKPNTVNSKPIQGSLLDTGSSSHIKPKRNHSRMFTEDNGIANVQCEADEAFLSFRSFQTK